jgi:hypothetical protein
MAILHRPHLSGLQAAVADADTCALAWHSNHRGCAFYSRVRPASCWELDAAASPTAYPNHTTLAPKALACIPQVLSATRRLLLTNLDMRAVSPRTQLAVLIRTICSGGSGIQQADSWLPVSS